VNNNVCLDAKMQEISPIAQKYDPAENTDWQ